jgi:hypothetical protein
LTNILNKKEEPGTQHDDPYPLEPGKILGVLAGLGKNVPD